MSNRKVSISTADVYRQATKYQCERCEDSGMVDGPCPNPPFGRNVSCCVRHLVACPECERGSE